MTESLKRKYPIPESELDKPFSQQEMYGLLRERSINLVVLDWFLEYTRAGEVFESLRSDNGLHGAELIQSIKQPDASVIELEFRWPVKSNVINQESAWGDRTEKAKSHPASFNSIVITIDRVQYDRPTLDFGNIITIEGKKIELVHQPNITPHRVKKAIGRAFLNPRTSDFLDKQV